MPKEFVFTIDHARAVAIEEAERLFINGNQGDAVMLLKGRDGRIVAREWAAASFDEPATSFEIAGPDGRFKPAPQLNGLSTSDIILATSQNETIACTIRGPGGTVSFRQIRTSEGAVWSHADGWRQNGKHDGA